jgi:hypothetical protein
MFARSRSRSDIEFRIASRKRISPLVALFLTGLLSSAFPAASAEEARQSATDTSPTPGSRSTSKSFDLQEIPEPKRWKGFEVVPGKDPNGWSFIIEPYGWAMGLSGDIGVRGFPPAHVDFSAKDILQHLDWGIFAKGEIRKGRWGILADGFYAELSASGDPPGPLYEGVDVAVQQGLASLALAYRIISDRRGFLDIYAGARYNYFGIDIGAEIDEGGIQQVGDDVTQIFASQMRARVQSAVDVEVQRLQVQFADEEAVVEEDIRVEEALLREDVRARIAASLESDLQERLRRDLASNRPLREAIREAEISRIIRGLRSEFRAFLNAALEARLAEDDARLAAARAGLDLRLAEARTRVEARVAQARANAQARIAQAEKKLSKAIAQRIEDALPTAASGDQWWVDPIVGLRGQINLTRWLFLAVQGDVGGFGAASVFAANVSASLGINFTRNIFLETGYRFFYMDRSHDGFSYDAGEYGLFSGIGVKF